MTHVTRQTAANCHAAQMAETNTLRRHLLEPVREPMSARHWVGALACVIGAIALGWMFSAATYDERPVVAQHAEASE